MAPAKAHADAALDPVRKLIDCLIAAVAIRERVTVLHNDRDFDVLTRHTRLGVEPSIG